MILIIEKGQVQKPLKKKGVGVVTIGNHFPIRKSLQAYRDLWKQDDNEGKDFRKLLADIEASTQPVLLLYTGKGSNAEFVATNLIPQLLKSMTYICHPYKPTPEPHNSYKEPIEELAEQGENRWEDHWKMPDSL